MPDLVGEIEALGAMEGSEEGRLDTDGVPDGAV